MTKRRRAGHGSSLDSFLEQEGTLKESQAIAIKEVEIWLTEEQIRGIETALSQADRGEFATEEEIRRGLHEPWA